MEGMAVSREMGKNGLDAFQWKSFEGWSLSSCLCMFLLPMFISLSLSSLSGCEQH